MTVLPAGISTGLLTANIFELIGDSTTDTDRNPDAATIAQLKLHIRADLPAISLSGVKKIAIPRPESYSFNAAFDLIDKANAVGVHLVASDNAMPTERLTYTATLEAPPQLNIPLLEWTFEIYADQTLDLSRVQAVRPSSGARIVRGESAYDVARANGFVGTETQWLASLISPNALLARGSASDLNTLYGAVNGGSWSYADNTLNAPSITNGVVIVSPQTVSPTTGQIALSGDGFLYYRRVTATTRTPWKRFDIDEGAVRFDSVQSLSDTAKGQAQANIARGTTTNLDALYGGASNGLWLAATGTPGNPFPSTAYVLVQAAGNSSGTLQIATSSFGEMQVRFVSSSGGGSWFGITRYGTNVVTPDLDLNNLTTPGTYLLSSIAASAAALNYPPRTSSNSSKIGHLVVEGTSPYVRQLWTHYTTAETWVRVRRSPTDWSEWRRIDQQDTGWRDVSSLLTATWEKSPLSLGRCELVRVGDLVTFTAHLAPIGAALGTPRTGNVAHALFAMPVGFRPLTVGNVGSVMLWYGRPVTGIVGFHNSGADFRAYLPPAEATAGVFGPTDQLSFTATWRTKEAFPTTLPGTPV